MKVTAAATIYLDVSTYLMWLPAQCPCRYKCDRGHVGLQLSSGKPIPRSPGRDNQIVQPWPHPGQCQPAARDHWFADPSVMQKAARNAHLSAKLSQMIIPRAQKITNKSYRDQKIPYLYDQAFTVKRLELGTGAMWIRLDYLDGRFSSLWSLSCDVRFPRVEAHINIRDATVSGIRGRQGPEQESGACAWVTRWVADCSADVTIQCAFVADKFMF